MPETDSQLSLLMNALGFRESRVESRSAAGRGLLGAERARLLPGVFGGQDIPDEQLAGLQDTFGEDFGRDDLAALSAGGSPIDTQFDRQSRAIEVAREDQGLFRSGFTGQLLAENEAQRGQAQADLISQFLASEFDIFDRSQSALDEIELQRAQGNIDFFVRDQQRALANQGLGGGGGTQAVLDPFGGAGSANNLLQEITAPPPAREVNRAPAAVTRPTKKRTSTRTGSRGFPAGVL